MKKEEIKITKYELEDADVNCLDNLCQIYHDYIHDNDTGTFGEYLKLKCQMDADEAEYLDEIVYTLQNMV